MKTIHTSKLLAALLLIAALLSPVSCCKETPQQDDNKPNQGQTDGDKPNGGDETDDGKDNPDNGEEGGGKPSIIELPEVSFSDTEGLLAYINEAIDVCFELTGGISETLDVSFASDGKSAVDGAFDPSAGKGSVSVTLGAEAQRSASTVSVILKDGEQEKAFDFEVTAYYLDITANSDDIVFTGNGGESKELEYTVETNISGFVPKVTVNADWLSYADGMLTTSADNATGEVRTTTVLIADVEARFEGASVSVTQEFIIVDPEGCVRFIDPAFRAAMASIADRDGDGFVSYDEALAVTEIFAVGKGIRDLTGLDAFTNVWKLDLRNNDIEDATVLKELPHLYWLDLKGNKHLKTFDVTGCSFYFEHCEFDVNENLLYYTARRQINVSWASDEYPYHFSSKEDPRESVDYSRQNELHLLRRHTKGTGKKAIVIAGRGYIDIDILDGTWNRIVDKCFAYLINDYPKLQPYLDYLDIYSLDHISNNRYQYICTVGEVSEQTEHYKEVK